MAHGDIFWTELNTWEPEKAKAFYEEVMGWTFKPMELAGGGTYYVAINGERPVAGIFPLSEPDFKGMPSHWFSYIQVEDIRACREKALAAGATIRRDIFSVDMVGECMILQQPDGAVVGWTEPAPCD